MLIGLFTGNALQIFFYYLIFLVIDASVSIMAYIFEGERLWVLLWVIPQRFFYRWIMYYVLFKSYLKAIKGELQTWGVLKRTGHVGPHPPTPSPRERGSAGNNLLKND